jgi:hypothetical protein
MVEFGLDLGPRGALESGPRLQLGSRFEDAAAGRLLRSLKERLPVVGNQGRFGAAVILHTL